MADVLAQIGTLISEGKLHSGRKDPAALAAFGKSCGAECIRAYLEFLGHFNGISSFDGYFRIFGIGSKAAMDAIAWNDQATWKDAWPQDLSAYWCFGETGWGDQYAFRPESGASTVFFLEAVSMAAEVIAPNFVQFLEQEFVRNVHDPYDERLRRARRHLGRLPLGEHITYVPSILITGSEEKSEVQRLPAAASMIINGDLFRQLGEAEIGRDIQRVDIQDDESGRPRARVIWATK